MNQFEIEQIDAASLDLLENVGVRLEHDEVLQRVIRAGGRPGSAVSDVRFPRRMVADFLSLAPASVQLDAVNGASTCLTPHSDTVFWTCPVLYVWTGTERRQILQSDLAQVCALTNRLPNVQGVMGVALADVQPLQRDFVGVRIMAERSQKHLRALCFSGGGMEALAEMKPLLPGNWFSIGFTAHGPLRWTHLALDVFLKSAGQKIPVTINGEPMAGVTGPVTLAGNVVVGNAEILAGIVVNQVLEPGRPVIYNLGLAHVFDMKHATAVTGGPENALLAEASAELGRYYELPSASWVSTESLFEDEQAAMEKTFGVLTHVFSGVSLVWGMGQLESEMTISLAQLVIDNEIVDFVRRYRRGLPVDDESIGLETIKEAGISGSYLEREHTLRNFRNEIYHPQILNRSARTAQSRPLAEVAKVKAEELLREAPGSCLPWEISAELRRIEEHYRRKVQ
ncbi:MAG: trimethylamine methyltransferase family protein [Acidobacteriota bacterium]